MSDQSDAAARATHVTNVDISDRPGPFILTACVGHDGSVWAVLSDAAGGVVAKTRRVPEAL